MDWGKVPYFLATARSGSLRAAADTVGATHATVDRNIRALEDEYGVRLFERSRGGLSLTVAGEKLIPFAEEAETSLLSARRALDGLDAKPRGMVRLSIPTGFATLILPPILAKFERLYPDIELVVTVTNRFEDLNRAEADVSLRISHHVEDDVIGRKLLQYAGGIFASQEYLDREWDRAGAQGEGLQWIGWGEPSGKSDWVKASPFPKARVRYHLRSPTLILSMVEQGLGMSHIPYFCLQSMKNVVPVPGTEPYFDRSVWLLLHSELQKTMRVRVLVDFLAQELRNKRDQFLGPLH